MLNGVVNWLKELTIFMVICETILSFAPTSAYKRYIKPFVGLILLLWITSFLFGEIHTDWNKKMEQIFIDYEQAVSHYLENVPLVEGEKKQKYQAEDFTLEYDFLENEKLNEYIIKVNEIVVSPIRIGEIE